MPTYTVKFTALRGGVVVPLTTNIAGCTDEADAERKVGYFYADVVKVKSVTLKPAKS